MIKKNRKAIHNIFYKLTTIPVDYQEGSLQNGFVKFHLLLFLLPKIDLFSHNPGSIFFISVFERII